MHNRPLLYFPCIALTLMYFCIISSPLPCAPWFISFPVFFALYLLHFLLITPSPSFILLLLPHTPLPLQSETLRYSSEASRHTHTTSASYLDLLKVYQQSIGRQREHTAVLLERYKAGVAKLKECEDLLDQLGVSQLPSF
jgi:hypothetical protein